MKITVITGSPRKGGNTFAMVDAFIKAAEAKGHKVMRFDAAMMKVGGCHACMTCFKTGKVWAQSEIPVHDILHKLLNLRHENLPCILVVPSRRA